VKVSGRRVVAVVPNNGEDEMLSVIDRRRLRGCGV